MIATYTDRPTTVRALQLRADTLDELLRWTLGYRLGVDRWIPSESCWRVSALRWYPPPYVLGPDLLRLIADPHLVGIRTRSGPEIVQRGQWVVQASGHGGGFRVVSADVFDDRYLPAGQRVT